MAVRKTILATNEIYHVFNRGVEKRLIFLRDREYRRFSDLINYYRFENCPIKFSYFKALSKEEKIKVFQNLEQESRRLVDVYAYCLMPNHFHLLVEQLIDNGISKFLAKTSNGYSHFFNTLNKRTGHLFEGNFKAVRIEDDEQFVHINRYIHLNPVTSFIIEYSNLENYKYSSYSEYIQKRTSFVNIQRVLSYFKNVEEYKKFIEDQVDYARKLDSIKHLVLE